MSAVFNAILIAENLLAVQELVSRLSPEFPVDSGGVCDQLSVIAQVESRNVNRVEEMTNLAMRVSVEQPALYVLVDQRTSFRASALYRNGMLVCEFGPEDELFVPLDDDGNPMTEATPVKESEFEEDQEYETILNAVDLGLRELGVKNSWKFLQKLMPDL